MKTLSLGGKICLILFGKLLILLGNSSLIVGETDQVVREPLPDGTSMKLHGISKKLLKEQGGKEDCSQSKDEEKETKFLQSRLPTISKENVDAKDSSRIGLIKSNPNNHKDNIYNHKDIIEVHRNTKADYSDKHSDRKLHDSPCDSGENCTARQDEGEC